MRPTSTPKIEHEDNFFIELDLLSFWPTKNYCSFIGIDPTINMSGPPPTGAGYNFCRSCSIELQTWYGFSCATPLLKYFTGFNLYFFLNYMWKWAMMLEWPSWSGELNNLTWPRNRTHIFFSFVKSLNLFNFFFRRRPHQANWCVFSLNHILWLE